MLPLYFKRNLKNCSRDPWLNKRYTYINSGHKARRGGRISSFTSTRIKTCTISLSTDKTSTCSAGALSAKEGRKTQVGKPFGLVVMIA